MFVGRNFIAGACAVALGLGAVSQAAGASSPAVRTHTAGAETKVHVLERSSKRFERSVDVYRQHRERHQRRREAATAPDQSFAPPEQYGISQSTLETVASCESGGDPAAVSSDGTYRGKYQFDSGTWASVGGSGDPAAAPEAEQDMRAAMLYAQSGSSPWPICG